MSMLCEPVLAFVKAFRLRGDANALKQAALGRFNSPSLANAKKVLWEACSTDLSLLELPFTPRRSSEKRSQASADLEDILLAFDKLDDVDKIPLIFCEATDLVKLPPIAADPISEMVSGNAASLKELDERISELQVALQKLASRFESNIPSRSSSPVSFANAVKMTVHPTTGDPTPVIGARRPHVIRDDRADNLVIFGLPETNSLPSLKNSVDELFTFLVGKPVHLKDIFRLGRPMKPSATSVANRPRPVLVKLTSSWDRRVVLSVVRKTKDYGVRGIFIREDLSPEEREIRRERALSRKNAVTKSTPTVSSQCQLPPNHMHSDKATESV